MINRENALAAAKQLLNNVKTLLY